ncbi:MAG: hypothetical protein ACTSU5_11635 [Promethearchaeota archaeon]
MPTPVAFMQLSSCWGCHQSLLNAHLGLLPILPDLDIVYWPAVVDFKHESLVARPDKSVVVGFIEGMIRTHEDLENVKLMRQKCVLVVAFGTCACYGGIPGLANLYSKEDLLKRKFLEADSIAEGGARIPTENVPDIEESVVNVDQVIDVDAYIPGCPPRTENIIASVLHLLGLNLEKPTKAVCEICPLRGDDCLLNKGELCFGPVAGAKDGMKTPVPGRPSLGEYGLSPKPAMPEAVKLFQAVAAAESLDQDTVDDITEFILLAAQVPTIGSLRATADPLRGLATNPEAFSVKDIQVPEGGTVKGIDLSGLKDQPYIKVTVGDLPDLYADFLGVAALKLRDSGKFKYGTANVCDTCPRKRHNKLLTDLKRDYEGLPNLEDCILDQGWFCAGPVTAAGCGALCPRVNAPCLGCYGPAALVKDQGAKILSTIASIAEMEPDQLLEKIPDPAGLFYRFSLASGTLYKKFKDKEG